VKKPFIHFICLLLSLVTLEACAQKKKLTAEIKYIQPYCGGARPTEEILEDAKKEKKYSGMEVILVSDKNKVIKSKTDQEGKLNVKAGYGTYKLYEAWRYNKQAPNGEDLKEFDENCLKAEWARSFMTIEFTKAKTVQKSEGPIILFCSPNAPCLRAVNHIPHRE